MRMAKKIDLLYIRGDYHCYNEFYTLLKIYRAFRLPVVWEMNAPLEELYAPGFKRRDIHRMVKKGNLKRRLYALLVDAAICVSTTMVEYSKNYLGIKKSYNVPNGTDPDLFRPGDASIQKLKEYKNLTKILWAGSPEYPWHGYDLICQLADRIFHIDDSILFILTTNLENQKPHKEKNILFIDKIAYNDLPGYINSCDITLALYNDYDWCKYGFYNSPMKLFDYMACAKPVIASRMGQIEEVIEDGVNGLLTDNSIEDLMDKIIFLKNKPEEAILLGKKAREKIETFYNWDRVVKQTVTVFEDLLRNQ